MLLYFAGTMIMFDPSNECIHDFWKEGMLKSLPVSSNNPRFIKASSQLRGSVDDPNSVYDRMKADYLALFKYGGNPFAPPYESSYRKTAIINGTRGTSEVTEFYKSYGWVSHFKNEIPDDHIGIELLFLTLMIEKYLELDDEACHREMQNEIRRFISQHVMSWVPAWNKNVQENAMTLSYKGISTLIQACIEDIYGMMESKEPEKVRIG